MAETGASEGASDGKAAGIRRVAVPGVATPDFPISHVVIYGTYAFLSGIVASDPPGGAAAHGDISRETELVMAAIREALAHVGLGMERIVRVDAHLTEIGRMPEFDRVYRRFFPNGAFPARSWAASPADPASSHSDRAALSVAVHPSGDLSRSTQGRRSNGTSSRPESAVAE